MTAPSSLTLSLQSSDPQVGTLFPLWGHLTMFGFWLLQLSRGETIGQRPERLLNKLHPTKQISPRKNGPALKCHHWGTLMEVSELSVVMIPAMKK